MRAGDSEASAAAAAGAGGVTTRLPAGALPPELSPHPLSRRILRRSLQSPRAGGEGEKRGGEGEKRGGAPLGGGAERWLVRLASVGPMGPRILQAVLD